MKQILTLIAFLVVSITSASAQTETISGQVTDLETGEPMIGATILVRETGDGTVTDLDGNYSLRAERGQTLVISYTGYATHEFVVGEVATYNIALAYSATQLEEIVVTGYGTQRAKDVTSAITTVSEEEINRTPTGQAMQSLQGKVAGLQIVSNGAPGAAPTVRVRGIGSYPTTNGSQPLYVVDGMFFDNIDFLNPTEIQSISVLKDASAAAIYGVRAANGVIIIETKSGRTDQKPQITYDGYYGVQVPTNVLQMANSEQFATMARESGSAADVEYIENAMQRWGRSEINPNVPDVNTDWYKEVMRNAAITNHTLGITGGSRDATYAVSGSYFSQDGILNMENGFERFNLRARVDLQATDWLKVGGNVLFSNIQAQDPEYGAWNTAYFAPPVLPIYDEANTAAWPVAYTSAEVVGYRGGKNPFTALDFNDNYREERNTVVNFYGEIDILPTLKFKSAYYQNFRSINRRIVDLPYYITDNFARVDAFLTRNEQTIDNKIWDNTLTYDNSFGLHNLTAMAGMSFRDEAWSVVNAQGVTPGNAVDGNGFPVDQKNAWYISQMPQIQEDNVYDGARRYYGLSYFGRVAYNYNHKYILYATFRADGTSKYQEKWGYFPTIGAGWVLTEEDWFDSNILDYLKLRVSWGQLGNDKVAASDGAITTSQIGTAINDQLVFGTNTSLAFSSLKWEVVEETNIGISSYLFNNRLSAELDYYIRDTRNAVIPVLLPAVGGSLLDNVGIIRNSGFEAALQWTEGTNTGFHYSIGVNFATLKNEVRDLYGQRYIDGGSAEFRQRSIVGEPVLAFYGLEVAGVYQTQEEIEADPIAVAEGLVPGDFRYRDTNGDGVLNDDDRVVLGSYLPSITYGGNINVGWKGLNLAVSLYGQAGNKILNRKRGEIIWTQDGNLDADLAKNRWHGEGTSNEYPSSSGLRRGWNQKLSDYLVEDGGFFRIQNIQLSYTLGEDLVGINGFPKTTIRLTADRPFTFFNYNGFSPEHSNGIDTQTFPIPATYTVGLNLQF